MKLSSKIIFALTIFVIGMALILLGAGLKINHYQNGILAGNNVIVLGMLMVLGGFYLIAMTYINNQKK